VEAVHEGEVADAGVTVGCAVGQAIRGDCKLSRPTAGDSQRRGRRGMGGRRDGGEAEGYQERGPEAEWT